MDDSNQHWRDAQRYAAAAQHSVGKVHIFGAEGEIYVGTAVLASALDDFVESQKARLYSEVARRLPIQLLDPVESFDEKPKTISITFGALVPSRQMIRTVIDEIWAERWADGFSPSIVTLPRTDNQARRRLPAQPGPQLYYSGLRIWGESIERAFLKALSFARCLGL